MQGEILTFNRGTGEGEIAGDDLARYRFSASDARGASGHGRGSRVAFTVSPEGRAVDVTALAAATEPDLYGRFDIGRVVQRAFAAIGRNWLLFFGGAAVLVGVPSLLLSWGQSGLMTGSGASIAIFAVGLLLYAVGFYLLEAVMLKTAINGFSGKSTPMGAAFDTGLKNVLPLLGLGILAGLGIGFGYLLLIVPGIFLTVSWMVAAPVLVAERQGVFDSLKRSADLTEGHRWSLFGLLVIYVILTSIIGVVVGAVATMTGLAAFGATEGPIAMVINFISNTVTAVIAAAGAASVYYELRTAKEGTSADELAAIFD